MTRVTGSSKTPIAETSVETILETSTESTAEPTPPSVIEKLQEIGTRVLHPLSMKGATTQWQVSKSSLLESG